MNDQPAQNTFARSYCASLPEVVLDFPFGQEVEVYKVCEKMFALFGTNRAGCGSLNLKCDPNEALMLRDLFPAIIPGYHMNKKHWNTVLLDGTLPNKELTRMIDNSYLLVSAGLTAGKKRGLRLRNAEAEIFVRG